MSQRKLRTPEEYAELVKAQQRIVELKKQNAKLHKELSKEKERKQDLHEAVYDAASIAFSELEIKPVKQVKKDTRKLDEEVAVIWCADWQMGKVTPTYNSRICSNRIDTYGEKILEITDIQRKSKKINKAHIWLLGDIIEGTDIFPGQAWLVDSGLYKQILDHGLKTLSNLIRTLLTSFETIHITGVIGNHGRLGRIGQHSYDDNGDRMLYKVCEMLFADEKRVTWDIPEGADGDRGWYAVDKIGNYSSLLVHGDQFRGQLGIPWYGVRKKVLGWKSMSSTGQMPEFKDVSFGHWHQIYSQDMNGITVRCSGSPESSNPYAAENLAAMGRASQRMMFVNPKKGIVTAEYQGIWLE